MSINSPKICRICMISDESIELLSIFELHNNIVGESVSILEKLSSINIQIIKHDCLPEDICKICISELNAAIKFREKSQNSERILRNVYLGNNFSEHLFQVNKINTNYEQTEIDKSDENLALPIPVHECLIKIEELDEVNDTHSLKTENSVAEQVAEQEQEKTKNPLTFEENKLMCKICYKTFGHVRFLKRHIARHLNAGNKPLRYFKAKLNLTGASCLEDNKHICAACDKTFSQARYLKRHIERHLKAGNKPLKRYKKSPNLTGASIEKTDKNVLLTYKCNKCGMCFNSQSMLRNPDNVKSEENLSFPLHQCVPQVEELHKVIETLKTKKNLVAEPPVEQAEPLTVKENKFICKICGSTFGLARSLNRHITRHMKAGNKPLRSWQPVIESTKAFAKCPATTLEPEHNETLTYECKKCGMCFKTQKILTIHTNKHSQHDNKAKKTIELDGVKPSSFFCAHCNRETREKRHLRRHILRIHINPKVKASTVECVMCTSAFSDEQQLKKHMFNQHDSKSCSICNKKLKNFKALKYHHVAAHEKFRDFLCSLCGKSFPSLTILKSHLKSHSVEKNYICNICSNAFKNKGHIKEHIIHTHLKLRSFACDFLNCNAKFCSRSSLKLHHQVHTGDGKRFKCVDCSHMFRSTYALLRHRRTHTGEKPNKCPYDDCGKAFSQKGDLNLHIRIHTGEKPHICDCGAAFRQSSTLKTHMKVHQKSEQTVMNK